MQFLDAVKIVFKKYSDFRGVATRPEYWWFTLFVFLVGLIGGAFDLAIGQSESQPIQTLLSVALFLPQLTVMVRRNRDAGFSAWWLVLWVLPVVVFIASIASNLEVLSGYAKITDFEALSDEQLIASLVQLIPVVLPGLLALAAVGIFFFVVSLLPSKMPKQPVVASIDY